MLHTFSSLVIRTLTRTFYALIQMDFIDTNSSTVFLSCRDVSYIHWNFGLVFYNLKNSLEYGASCSLLRRPPVQVRPCEFSLRQRNATAAAHESLFVPLYLLGTFGENYFS